MILFDGKLGILWFFILNERVGDVVLLFLEDDEFDCSKIAELAANVVFLDLRGEALTDLLMLEM